MRDHEIEVQHFEVVDSAEEAKSVPGRLSECFLNLNAKHWVKNSADDILFVPASASKRDVYVGVCFSVVSVVII